MHEHPETGHKSFWKTPAGWAFLGFAAVAAFFLVTEHTAHVFGVLPWLLVLLCPLMHVFMHRGHGGHGGHDHGKPDDRVPPGGKDGRSFHQH